MTVDRLVAGLGRLVTERRTMVLVAAAIAGAACAVAIAHFGLVLDNSPEVFEREGERAAEVLAELHARFGRDDAFVVLVEGDVVDPTFLDRLGALDEALATAPLPAGHPRPTVVSIATATFPVQLGTSAAIFPLIDRELEPDFMRRELLDNPFVNGRLVGRDARWTAVWVRTAPLSQAESAEAYAQLEHTLAAHAAPGFEPVLGGLPALDVRLNALTVVDMGRALILAGLAMTLLLIALFRHPVGVLGPVLVVNGSILATFAAMAATGTTVNYLNSIVPTFLVAVGTGDGVHLQTVYRQLRAQGLTNAEAIQAALRKTARPVFYTSITTIAGLMSFRAATLRPIVELGTLAALGVAVALVLSLTVLPAFLTLDRRGMRARSTQGRVGPVDRFVAGCWRLGRARPRTVAAAGAACAIAALALAATVRVSHDPLAWFPDDLPTRRVQRLLDEHFSGAAQLDLLVEVEPPAATLADPPVIAALAALQARIRAYRDPEGRPLVGVPVSPTSSLRDKPTAEALLTDAKELRFGLKLLHDRFPDVARLVVSADDRWGHVLFPLRWLPATEYAPLTAHVQAAIAEAAPAGLRVRPTGVVYSLLSTMGVLVPDLIRSFGIAFGVITLLMIALLRDLRLGVVAMVPNLLPIVCGAALMGALDIPLDASTVLLFGVALGLCVDDTIHLIHRFQATYAHTGDVDGAIEATLTETGRAVVYTSLLLVAATAPTLLSTLRSLVWFGGVLAFVIASALLADLLLTPVVLRWVVRGRTSAG